MSLPLIPIAISLAKEFLPSLVAKVVGDKSGRVAASVIDAAASIAGVDAGKVNSEVSAEAVARVIRADPDRMLQYQERMAELNNAESAMYLEDRKDARDRDIDMRNAGYDNNRANWMIAGDIVGLLSCLAAMLYITWLGVNGGGGDNASNPIVMAINGPLGMLTQQFANGLRDAHSFEFGSSRGSKEKSVMMGGGAKHG